MSLRIKIFILIAGSLIAPIIVGLISLQLNTDMTDGIEYRHRMAEYRTWLKELRDSPIDAERIEEFIVHVPSEIEIRVFDQNRELLSSRTPDYSSATSHQYLFTETVRVQFTSGDKGLIVVTRPPNPYLRDNDKWYIPLTGLLFVAIMVVIIVNSINRSIGRLEKATRRIAEGDLDFELPMKGNDKLASLTRSFDSMRGHLKEEYARRSRFIMGISHDLKTPLSSISGYANAIGEGYADTPAKLEKYVAIIEDKTKLLESRISMLIDYVRRETVDWKLNLKPVDLKLFFDELSNVFESEATINNHRYQGLVDIEPGLLVPMDEGMVIRALENLMHNALSYSPDESVITFACTCNNRVVSVSLTNHGPGIEPEQLPHIFDPFVRGERDRKGSGLGLGLSTVESILSSHGWHIDVESRQNDTTVFTITMPLETK